MALGYDGGGRTAKQCRGRYMHHLKPGLKRGPWTWEEEEALVAAHAEMGNSWSKIARGLPGRTETDIKNHCAWFLGPDGVINVSCRQQDSA